MARRQIMRPQRGVALLLFMVLMVMATLTYVVNSFSPEMIESVRQKRGQSALAEAQDALIGYALTYRERQAMIDIAVTANDQAMYGFLPMPDMGSVFNQHAALFPEYTGEGWATLNNSQITQNFTYVGRFPWRTVGTPPLRDSGGECLWYVVSASHREPRATGESTVLNWDTLGQLDLVNASTNGSASAQGLTGHDRPIAVIIAPGGRLNSINASPTADDVSQCGGNYVPGNYLEFTTLGPSPFNTTTAVGGNTSAQPKPVATRGKIFANTTLIANDFGIPITADTLFSAIRGKSTSFRADINALLDRITSCLRDEFYTGAIPAKGKIAGADNNACYGSAAVPLGYYPSYREMLFVVPGAVSANGNSACAGALLFGSQRASGQLRDTAARIADVSNYLEDVNLASYASGTQFSGPEKFDVVSTAQSASRDIVRCIPSTPNFVSTSSPGLAAAGVSQLTSYSAATSTLTLGQANVSAYATSLASDLFGCAWNSDTHAMGGGLRSYFTFRINDAGFSSSPHEGFTFAIVDGDNNGINACGAARQHLGYSGNNTKTPFLVPPKIGFEIDPRLESGFNPAGSSTLSNGRNDPSYTGGHVGIVYWGGETNIATGGSAPCTSPRLTIGSSCYLSQEEDDNVHGQSGSSRSGFPAPPGNPSAPATATTGYGIYKLDPNLSSVPVNQDIHVRVEVTRGGVTLSPARVASTTNLNLSAPGATIDGITLAANDRVLVKNQTTASSNGVYIWNGAGVPMTRAADADSAAELVSAVIKVAQGTTNAATTWRQTNTTLLTLGSSSVIWAVTGNITGATLPQVRVATTTSLNLLAPGATIDNVALLASDRVLVKDQSTASENGIYVWNGASSAMTRTDDADSSVELSGLVVEVSQGATNRSSIWRQTTSNLTLGSSPILWANIRVKLAIATNVVLAGPGATMDNIMMSSGDRVLLTGQTAASENGIYVWNGAASLMTRATDADTALKLTGIAVQVQQGSNATAWWRYDGTSWYRSSVRVATLSSIDLANPGASIGGITLAAGDRVLVKDQTSKADNGIYVWNGAASAMTRATDANTPAALDGMVVQVESGAETGRAFRQTSLVAGGTLGTSTVEWAAIDPSPDFLIEVWILSDSATVANQIAAMKNTTKPMSLLYPGLSPHIRSTATIGYPFRNVRLGFTTGQRTSITDQTFSIKNSFTSWID